MKNFINDVCIHNQMVMIQNGFCLPSPLDPADTYTVWTRQPSDLEGQCRYTDFSRSNSFRLLTYAGKKGEAFHLRDDIPHDGKDAYMSSLITQMIGYNQCEGEIDLKSLPLGTELTPESFAVMQALSHLAQQLSMDIALGSITDLVIREARFVDQKFTSEATRYIRQRRCNPQDFPMLHMTTDLYVR